MKRIRLMGLCLVAVFATSAIVVSSVSAAPPEFEPLLKLTEIKGNFGAVKIVVHTAPAVGEISCSGGKLEGEVEFAFIKPQRNVEDVNLGFKGCKEIVVENGKAVKKCTGVKSPGRPAGTIVTRSLRGELGKVLVAEAPVDERGLDLKPEIGAIVMRIEAPGCGLPLTVVEGSIIGEIRPKGPPLTLEKELVFALNVGKEQMIQKFEPPGVKDTLNVGAPEVTLKGTIAKLIFLEKVEVT
jgi:hypothetical protein